LRPVEVVYLRRRDTVDTARELLNGATPGAEVWVVVPWRLRLALKLVNLRRLQRTAEDAALDLRLVSSHSQTRALAREAGIPVRFFLPFRLRRNRSVRRPGTEGLVSRVLPAQARSGARRARRSGPIGVGAVLLSLVVIFCLVAVLLGAAVSLLPSATITLEPVSEPVDAALLVRASPAYREIDYGEAIIPARMVQVIVAGTGETPTTARLDVPEGHASGEVVFANRTTEPVTVPKGTIVRTSSGVNVRFYSVGDVELPPTLYGHARVRVIALEPGPSGNVSALTINAVEGEVADLVDVLNDSPTQGGNIRRVAIVSYKDFDVLRANLIERLQQEAYEQLVSELSEDEFVPPNSLDVQVMSQKFDQVVDQQSDVLSMEMKTVARGVAVDGQLIRELAARLLQSRAEEGYRLIEDSMEVQRSEDVQMTGGEVHFDMVAWGLLAPIVEVDRAKTAIRGKTSAQALEWFDQRYHLESRPRILMVPTWWDRMPWLPARMDIIISSTAR
jgi:hypothetical protein